MADELDEVVARDEVVLAERAVAMLEEERAARVADVAALDGVFTAAWTRLLGNREARIEEAVAAVAAVDRRLAAAKDRLRRAVGGSEQVREQRVDEERRRAEEAAAAEAALAALAEEQGPRGDGVRSLLLERELLRDRLAKADEAAFSGSDLVGALMTPVQARSRHLNTAVDRMLRTDQVYGDLAAVAVGYLDRHDAFAQAQSGLVTVPGKAARFQAALAALGEAFTMDLPGSSLAGALLLDPLQGTAEECADAAGRVRHLLVPVDRERRELQARLEVLERELADLR